MKIMGWIRLGDKAACGAQVIEGLPNCTLYGGQASFEGAKMACSKGCYIGEGHPAHTLPNGRKQPHHGHITLPGACPLISTLNDKCGRGVEGGQHVAAEFFQNADGEWAGIKAPAPHEDSYDEQPQLISPPIEGVPYFVETTDGRTFSGRIGADNLLPRIDTYGEDEYTVHWGDEALARMEDSYA